jgi:hypothetical protein
VGKTHTALLLAEAYFAYKDKKTGMYKGLLWMSGTTRAAIWFGHSTLTDARWPATTRHCGASAGKLYQMAKSEEEIKAAREYIHEQIIDHLAMCPQAIIVVRRILFLFSLRALAFADHSRDTPRLMKRR